MVSFFHKFPWHIYAQGKIAFIQRAQECSQSIKELLRPSALSSAVSVLQRAGDLFQGSWSLSWSIRTQSIACKASSIISGLWLSRFGGHGWAIGKTTLVHCVTWTGKFPQETRMNSRQEKKREYLKKDDFHNGEFVDMPGKSVIHTCKRRGGDD